MSARSSLGAFFDDLKKKRIIEILAAFIGGGWLIIEFVHFILIGHYHFPEKTLDITLITLISALICALIWRWFSGRDEKRKFKLELVLIPLVALITIVLDINLLLHMNSSESETVPTSKWKNSVAVLPFDDFSPQKDQDYFCNGLTEELISRLSNIRELKVTARDSAFFFKGKSDVREIGSKLDVRTVLTGSVRKAGDRLRITAQLINTANRTTLWSYEQDRELKDVFAIQDEIALAVADKLKITLLDEEKANVTKRFTNSIDANISYLKGRQSHLAFTPDELKKAIGYFEQALEKDPRYALAYSGLADIYYELCFTTPITPKDAMSKAKTYLTKALEIDGNLAETHASLGRIIAMYDWNWPEAGREFERALELNQNSSIVHVLHAVFLSVTGQHKEAILAAERARQLDPLSSEVSALVGEALFWGGRLDAAIQDLKQTIRMDPSQYYPHALLGLSYQGKAMMTEAVEVLEKALRLPGGQNQMVEAPLAIAYYRAGAREEADALFNRLAERAKREYVSRFCLFEMYRARGDQDKTYEWLEKACQDHDLFLPYCLIWPDDAYRIPYDQRSADLLKNVGLVKAARE